MNKNKTFSLIMSKNLIALSFLFSFLFNSLQAQSRVHPFWGYLMFSFGIFHASTAFRSCPYLYEKGTYKTLEVYLDFLENRIINWHFLLEKHDEDQLNSFRSELLESYEQILKKRSFFSSLFLDSAPYQPWALFKEEINQHLNQLSFYKCSQIFKKTKNLIFKTNVPLYSKELLDRITRLETTLNKIKKCIQSWPSYQNECSQTRQEKEISRIFNYLAMFYCFYFANWMLEDT
jgi:hypothetical protein